MRRKILTVCFLTFLLAALFTFYQFVPSVQAYPNLTEFLSGFHTGHNLWYTLNGQYESVWQQVDDAGVIKWGMGLPGHLQGNISSDGTILNCAGNSIDSSVQSELHQTFDAGYVPYLFWSRIVNFEELTETHVQNLFLNVEDMIDAHGTGDWIIMGFGCELNAIPGHVGFAGPYCGTERTRKIEPEDYNSQMQMIRNKRDELGLENKILLGGHANLLVGYNSPPWTGMNGISQYVVGFAQNDIFGVSHYYGYPSWSSYMPGYESSYTWQQSIDLAWTKCRLMLDMMEAEAGYTIPFYFFEYNAGNTYRGSYNIWREAVTYTYTQKVHNNLWVKGLNWYTADMWEGDAIEELIVQAGAYDGWGEDGDGAFTSWSDGFETGDLSKWNNYTGEVNVTDTYAYKGSYSANLTSSEAAGTGGEFGYTTIGGTGVYLSSASYEHIKGSIFTANENGTADSITVILHRGSGSDLATVKCAIYFNGNKSLLDSTEERDVSLTTSYNWYTFDFDTPPSIVSGIEYILVAWANYTDANIYVRYDDGTTNQGVYQSLAYGTFPSTLVPDGYNDREYSIYCSYSTTQGTKLRKELSTSLSEVFVRTYLRLEDLPDTNHSSLRFLECRTGTGTLIAAAMVYRLDSTYYWAVMAGADDPITGGNYTSATINADTWYGVELYVNATTNGNITLWVDDTLKCEEIGDHSSYGMVGRVQLTAFINGEQISAKTVYQDSIVIDDERIYSGVQGLFFTVSVGELPLEGVRINGSLTNENGYYEWTNLTYGQLYTFVVERAGYYYPSWILNAEEGFTWNGTHFIISHNYTESGEALKIYFSISPEAYVKQLPSGMKLTGVETQKSGTLGDAYYLQLTGSSWIAFHSSSYNEEPFLSSGSVSSKTYNSTTRICNMTIYAGTTILLLFDRPTPSAWGNWWD